MSEYTPETGHVRGLYVWGATNSTGKSTVDFGAEFDRWLATRDADAQAEIDGLNREWRETLAELELAEREIEHYKSLYEQIAAIHTPYRLREGRIPSPRESRRIRETLKGEGL